MQATSTFDVAPCRLLPLHRAMSRDSPLCYDERLMGAYGSLQELTMWLSSLQEQQIHNLPLSAMHRGQVLRVCSSEGSNEERKKKQDAKFHSHTCLLPLACTNPKLLLVSELKYY